MKVKRYLCKVRYRVGDLYTAAVIIESPRGGSIRVKCRSVLLSPKAKESDWKVFQRVAMAIPKGEAYLTLAHMRHLLELSKR